MTDDGPRDGGGDAVPGEGGERDDQPTVTVGSAGYQPDGETDADGDPGAGGGQGTTAGLENAVPAADDRFDWRGWVLVGVVVLCFLALPVAVTLRPVRVVGFRTTYLLLPLLPAVLLGATAVWVALRSRQ